MKIGMDVGNYLRDWAGENSEDFINKVDDIICNSNIPQEEKIKKIYTRTLDYIFYAMSEAIAENNRVIEKQLRRAGVHLP